MILGLLGGKEIGKYSLSPELWKYICKIKGVELNYSVHPIVSESELIPFVDYFISTEDFVGFNIALPWKTAIRRLIKAKSDTQHFEVNTIYKRDGLIRMDNTDIAALKSIIKRHVPNVKGARVLVLGGGGVGKPLSESLHQEGALVYVRDTKEIEAPKEIPVLIAESELIEKIKEPADIVINASPVGKGDILSKETDMRLPLKFESISALINSSSLVIECNYFPYMTPLLEVASLLGSTVVPGTEMFVQQGVFSASRFLGQDLEEGEVMEITNYISEKIRGAYK